MKTTKFSSTNGVRGAKGVTKCCPNLHVMTGQFWVKKKIDFLVNPPP